MLPVGRLTADAIVGELATRQSRLVHHTRHDLPCTRRSAVNYSGTLYVGLDVHKESIAVAPIAKEHDAEGISLGGIGTRQADIEHLVRKRQSKALRLVFVYAADPCGHWLSR
jgi:hypothetical protein